MEFLQQIIDAPNDNVRLVLIQQKVKYNYLMNL